MQTERVVTSVIDFSLEEEKRVLTAAIKFGMNEAEARTWLEGWLLRPAPMFCWAIPYSQIWTEEGMREVIQLMYAIRYGVYP